MDRLGEFVLRRALADGARWPTVRLGQSVAGADAQPRTGRNRRRRWPKAGMPASRLMLEVTEGVLIDNPDEALVKLEALRALGIAPRWTISAPAIRV